MFNICYHGQLLIRSGYNRNLIFSQHVIRYFLPFSTSASEKPSPKSSFMVDYLMNSCGLSMENAVTASADLAHVNSPEKPDSVIRFLKQQSFNDTQIKSLISCRPVLLVAKVDKTLKPKFRVLQDLGFSGPEVVDFIVRYPFVLNTSVTFKLLPFISLLRTVLHSDEHVIKVIKKSFWILNHGDIKKSLLPNISVLQKCGVSDHSISNLMLKDPWTILQRHSRLEEIIKRVEKMGISQDSGFFLYAIRAISSISKSTLDAKFKIFKSYGWSETDILSAFRRLPNSLMMSESKIQKEMAFFMGELKYEPSYIASHPRLLKQSLEKVVIPRYNVMQLLKSKNLIKPSTSFYSVACRSEKKFIETYVRPYMDKVPGVYEAYKSNMRDLPSPAT